MTFYNICRSSFDRRRIAILCELFKFLYILLWTWSESYIENFNIILHNTIYENAKDILLCSSHSFVWLVDGGALCSNFYTRTTTSNDLIKMYIILKNIGTIFSSLSSSPSLYCDCFYLVMRGKRGYFYWNKATKTSTTTIRLTM